MHEENKRSALKAISWHMISTATIMTLFYIFTGEIEMMAGVGFFDVVFKMSFYFIHERVWKALRVHKTHAFTHSVTFPELIL